MPSCINKNKQKHITLQNCVPFKARNYTDQLENEKNAKAISKVDADSVSKE